MSMSGGSVTVGDDEVATGSGLALALYTDDALTMILPTVPTLGDTTPPFAPGRACTEGDRDMVKAARLAMLRDAARRANAYGTALVTYITGNAKARLTNAQSAGRLPTFIDALNRPIDPPAADVLFNVE